MTEASSPPARCCCEAWGVSALVELRVETIESLKVLHPFTGYDPAHWWRCHTRCQVCGARWLVAADLRVHDNYLLRRLSDDELYDIESRGAWPRDYETFEELLAVQADQGKVCRFVDEQDGSLLDTVEDLLRENPAITVARIAYLLNIHEDNAQVLFAKHNAPAKA